MSQHEFEAESVTAEFDHSVDWGFEAGEQFGSRTDQAIKGATFWVHGVEVEQQATDRSDSSNVAALSARAAMQERTSARAMAMAIATVMVMRSTVPRPGRRERRFAGAVEKPAQSPN